jgi:acetylornithine deacetylase/succinyl-diaminopimelate desuccinylase-like protein
MLARSLGQLECERYMTPIDDPDPRLDDLFACIDQGEAAELALALGQINSPPGGEGPAGEYVVDWLRQNGIRAIKQEVLPGRFNAIGRLPGRGGGQSLILNSHLDVAYGRPEDIWTAGRFNRGDLSAWQDGDRLYGQSVVNDKAPMAATLLALKAIKQSGLDLAGDLIFAGVCGEIGQAPIDEFQGPAYEGKGIGTRYSLMHGIVADYALVAECSNWCLTATECGCLLVKVSVYGRAVYTPFLTRPADARQHPNAIVRAAHLVDVIEAWAADYQQRHSYQSRTGPVVPKVSIGAIRAGLPFKPIETAGVCALYLDIRVPPRLSPQSALAELRQTVAGTGLEAEIEPYLFRRGYEGQGTQPLEQAIERAHKRFFAEPPQQADAPVSSMWRDLNVYNEAGIPSVTYGPPLGLSSEGWSYFIEKQDILRAAKLYALIALDICSRQRRA